MKYKGAENLFGCLGACPTDKLLILTDEKTKSSARLLKKAYKGDYEIAYLPLERTDDIPQHYKGVDLHDKMQDADIILIAASQSWYHTPTRRKAKHVWEKRVATCTGLTPQMLEEGALCADYKLVARLTEELSAYYEGKEGICMTTEKGTDITADIKGRKCLYETGLYTKPGTGGNLPAGELPISPAEGTANGVVVYDISIARIGQLSSPIFIEITNGLINGQIGGEKAEDLLKLMRQYPELKNIAEISIGTNPDAIIYDRPVIEQEKKLGTGHIALGSNRVFGGTVDGLHLDGIFWDPTLTLLGKENITIMQNGKIPKELISDDLVEWLAAYGLVI
jgi:leucyl aminopeptidase (aminopeptidase T)